MPAFLVFLGGAATMVVYLKVSALVRIRELAAADFRWSAFLALVVLGALAGVGGHLLWARIGRAAARRFGGTAGGAHLRLAWAFADFPLAAYLVIFLPLDLLIVGPELFATERLDGSFPMVWGALSAAIALSATVWSAFLLWRGIEAATGTGGRGTFLMTMLAGTCYVACAALMLIVIAALGVLLT